MTTTLTRVLCLASWMGACGLAVPALARDAGALAELMPGVAAGLQPLQVPAGVRRIADLAYGHDPRQRFDVYLPTAAPLHGAPIIVMVHGGAWMVGNKGLPQVVEHKAAHWVTRGTILVSINYRLVPQVTPVEQADDVARAMAKVQSLATRWGGDPDRVVLMGHSAGAHLVALVTASPDVARRAGVRPWCGTVVLDSAALDPSSLMRAPHARFYDRVFGADPANWASASPTDSLGTGRPPMLMVCSTQRADQSCAQSTAFAAVVNARGMRASVSEQDLSHLEINATLGQPGNETDVVDAFLASIGAAVTDR